MSGHSTPNPNKGMNSYVVLLRGINVGGKNKIRMAALKSCLAEQGFEDVATYIQSGNVVLRSHLEATSVSHNIETALRDNFTLDSPTIRVLAIQEATFQEVVASAPNGFGNNHEAYRYDVIFPMGVTSEEAIKHIDVRQGVDEAWQGKHVIYYRRPSLASPNATKSYLGKLSQKPIYQSMTIRNWKTTLKLHKMLEGYAD